MKRNQKLRFNSTFILILLFLLNSYFSKSATNVSINGNGSGRLFDGIGVISGGGGNSRLLIDYPEPYRGYVLDYLFKPKFGAAFKEFKFEIGGDINSTSGVEPSHARTEAENATPFMHRGYETWLIDQAKKRNPGIILSALQWGAPTWVGNLWSQKNADYVTSYIKGLKTVWGYDLDYMGGNQNEHFNGTSTQARDYIVKMLRPTLNANGLSNVKIVAADILSGDWNFATMVKNDTELRNAVSAVGAHYVNHTSTADAKSCGVPIWESEGWTGVGDWDGAFYMAQLLNLNYVRGQMTKTDIWHMINSQYNNVNWPHSGVMEANAPWSGWYKVQPSIWAAAHTNQFAEVGWKYLDSGCGETANGASYVTLKDPNTNNYSIIIVAGANKTDEISFSLSNDLSNSNLHVWKSSREAQFIQQNDIVVSNNQFTISLEAGAIYSLTTTTGQQKGDAGEIPAYGSIGQNYEDDYDSYDIGKTPKYTYDIFGAFEVQNGDRSKVLRQVITDKGLEWTSWADYPWGDPFTEFGDLNWQNYDFSADVKIESTGYACIYGRLGQAMEGRNVSEYNGYKLLIKTNGDWSLSYGNNNIRNMGSEVALSSGTISNFDGNGWHNLKLSFIDNVIKVYIDNELKETVTDDIKCAGMVGFGSGFNYAQFDNVKIQGKPNTVSNILVSGATYVIKSRNSGKVLTPSNYSTNQGANIVQLPYLTNSTTQQWIFEDLGNDYWSIKNDNNGFAMDINGASTADAANNIQWPFTGDYNQQWKVVFNGCFYNLINRKSVKYLDISGGSTADNAQNIQWPANGGKNQQWELILVKSPTKIEEVKSNSFLEVFPNPTKGLLNIQSKIELENAEVSIINQAGMVLHKQNVNSLSNFDIDLTGYSAGFYMIGVKSKSENSIIKIVKY